MEELQHHKIMCPSENSLFQQAVDPRGDLPQITLESVEPHPGVVFARDYTIYGEDAASLGSLTLINRPADRGSEPAERYISRLALKEGTVGRETSNRRIGMAAMVLVAEYAQMDEFHLRTDPVGEYPPMLMLWRTLIDRGVARIIKPFAPSIRKGHEHSDLLRGEIAVPLISDLHR